MSEQQRLTFDGSKKEEAQSEESRLEQSHSEESQSEASSAEGSEEGSGESSRGRGRPPKPEEEKRKHSWGVHFNGQEKEEILEKAEAAGMKVSPYLRKAGLEKEIQSAQIQKLLAEIGRVGNNVNQIARRLNSGEGVRIERLEKEIEELQELMKEAMRSLSDS